MRKTFEVLELIKMMLDLAATMINFLIGLDGYLLVHLRYVEALQS